MEKENITRELWDEEWLAIHPDLDIWKDNGIVQQRKLRLWSLVLEARDIPFISRREGKAWQILVPAHYLVAAREELRLFEKENRNWPCVPLNSTIPADNVLSTLSVLILLAIFYNITHLDFTLFGHHPPDWLSIGSADSARIFAGEYWRLVTALTLHADLLHLVSNLAIGGIFVLYLCQDLGSGLAWSLILSSGILGNLVNAWTQLPSHSSIGSSTSIFGALGIHAAISMTRYSHQQVKRRMIPLAAALALLASLGTEGKNTDLGGHLFGFLSGIGLGMATGRAIAKTGRPGKVINATMATTASFLVGAAWSLAFLNVD